MNKNYFCACFLIFITTCGCLTESLSAQYFGSPQFMKNSDENQFDQMKSFKTHPINSQTKKYITHTTEILNTTFNKKNTNVEFKKLILVDYYCESTPYEHDYQLNGKIISHKNSWNRAKAGTTAILKDLCLLRNGLPLTRSCDFDKEMGQAKWENVPRIVCLNQTMQSTVTTVLNTLYSDILKDKESFNSTERKQNVISDIEKLITSPDKQLLAYDVHISTKILKELIGGKPDVELARPVLRVCNQLMNADNAILQLSYKLNSTNELRSIFEDYMNALTPHLVPTSKCKAASHNITNTRDDIIESSVEYIDLSGLGVYAELTSNISVFHINPVCSQVSGIAIYDITAEPTRRKLYIGQYTNRFKFGFLYTNDTVEDLKQEQNLQIATFIPQKLLEDVQNKLENVSLVLKFYESDAFFIENCKVSTRKPNGKVLSIHILNFSGNLPSSLPYLIRVDNTRNGAKRTCGYWGYNDTWLNDGVYAVNETQNENMLICNTKHLSDFTCLIAGRYRNSPPDGYVVITPLNERALDNITFVGSMLSLLGLFGIWLSAAILPTWRALASTKILLHMCLALTLQLVLLMFVNTNDIIRQYVRERDITSCVVIGALLQYATLVLFVWMLVVAILQYQRYVTIVGIQRPRHYILKSALLAWLLPLMPTLFLAFREPEIYLPSIQAVDANNAFCYPSGLALIISILVPVTIIVIVNTGIFIYILYSISNTLTSTMQVKTHLISKQIRLSVLLFFLFGMSWIFGLFSFFNGSVIFSYLFCITATLQGFILFLYFVVFEQNAQTAWRQIYFKKKYKLAKTKETSELMSMATTSTALSQNQNTN